MLIAQNASVLDWDVEADVNKVAMRRYGLGGAMVAIVAAVAGLAYWDARRESAAALQDFAVEQATLAKALGTALGIRAAADSSVAEDALLAGLRSIEREKALVIVTRRATDAALWTTTGRPLVAPRLTEALDRGDEAVRIPREEATRFGLPPRTALAGLSRVDAGAAGTWDIVAIASAERERDREDWARRRLVLSVATAAGLALAFGGVAMRNQRKELELERELALSSVQQRRDERLERASKAAAMGTLAMGVAHEISTPLGVIAARAEQMMPRVAGDDRLSTSVAAILSQTDRINQVIRGLLGLARGDAPTGERTHPQTLIENAVTLVEHRFAKAGVRLLGPKDTDVPVVVGDPRLLEQAIINLLLNACDACQPGGEVEIQARREGNVVEIAVTDSGSGISLADVGRALEPFFTTKAREGGTGLGLTIAHEIVASHRGNLVFSAHLPRGTRAAIRLPLLEEVALG
jgi:two-component system NtrC family sensor kinase